MKNIQIFQIKLKCKEIREFAIKAAKYILQTLYLNITGFYFSGALCGGQQQLKRVQRPGVRTRIFVN